jgi:hypothetical protein
MFDLSLGMLPSAPKIRGSGWSSQRARRVQVRISRFELADLGLGTYSPCNQRLKHFNRCAVWRKPGFILRTIPLTSGLPVWVLRSSRELHLEILLLRKRFSEFIPLPRSSGPYRPRRRAS